MVSTYSYQSRNIRAYLQSLYDGGLKKSNHLTEIQVEDILNNIGIFKFKGYYFAFKGNHTNHSIDDILIVYFFDKYLTRVIMDITSSIETKLKTTLVELCYKQIKSLPATHSNKHNPFFYLIKSNYKTPTVKLNYPSVQSWKTVTSPNEAETYRHYGLYYIHKYDFTQNKTLYLSNDTLISLHDDINYPPFHYLVEGATLGTVIYLIKELRLFGTYDLQEKVAEKFGISNINIDFIPYLERLKEIRNRAAHRERIFNRSYRSISRVGHYSQLSIGVNKHKFIDVHMFLFFMLNKLNHHADTKAFINDEIARLFREFKNDYYIRHDSKMLTKKIKKKEFDKIKRFILLGMK